MIDFRNRLMFALGVGAALDRLGDQAGAETEEEGRQRMTRVLLVSIDVLGHHVTITSDEGSGCYDVECTCGELNEETSMLTHATNLAMGHGIFETETKDGGK
jgi:hypothetical protein